MTARLQPPSFARLSNGDVVVARGDRNMVRWNGLLSSFVDVGVPAPTTTPTMAETTGGTIGGIIYCAVRFLDVDGRVSNISPISAALSIAVATKTITGATNAAPIEITATSHGFSTGNTVYITGVLGNYGANGLWTITSTGANTFTLDGSAGTGTYAAGGTAYQGASTITYSSVEDGSSDARVTRKQILRTKNGNSNVFYVDLDTAVDAGFTVSTTSKASTKTEAQLGTAVPLLDSNGDDLNQSRHSEPPPYKRFAAYLKGRIFVAGQLTYRQGGCTLTNGSASVVGLGTTWTADMAGWEFYPRGDGALSFTVSSINTGTQTITLDANYDGTTDPFAYYALVPPLNTAALTYQSGSPTAAERLTLYYGEADLPMSFDFSQGLSFDAVPQAGEITGLATLGSSLLILFENLVKQMSYSLRPANDGQVYDGVYRGCVNNNCWVQTDDLLYLMDKRGVYIFGGNYDEDVSSPIRPLFTGSNTNWKINWRHSEYFHAANFPDENTIKWYVVLDGGFYPHHAICFNHRLRRWWLEEYPFPICSSALGTLNGKRTVFLGSSGRRVFAAQNGTLDGPTAQDGTLNGTCTSSGLVSLSDTAAAFSSNVVGFPLCITGGTGKGQRRIVSAVAATKLTLTQPWQTLPDTTSTYQIGGIRWTYRTGIFRYAQSGKKDARALEVIFHPVTNAATLLLRRYVDKSATADTFPRTESDNGVTFTKDSKDITLTTTKSTGFAFLRQDSTLAIGADGIRRVQYEVEGVTNDEKQELYQLNVLGSGR